MSTRLAAFSFALLPVAACGGGGASPPAAKIKPQSIAITEANAVDVARAGYGMFDVVEIARIAARIAEAAAPDPADPTLSFPSGGFVQTTTVSGPQGGEATLTWTDGGDARYSTGDSFAIEFTGYGESSMVLTGSVAFDDVEIVGNVGGGFAWTISSRIGFALRVVADGAVTPLQGSLLCEREQRATVTLLTLGADADLPYGGRTLQAGSMLARNDYLLDFSMALFADATIVDPALGGAVGITTKTPMTGMQAMADPWAGALTVSGDHSSVMDVAAIDLFNAELRIDLQGDDVIDAVVPVEWSSL